MNYTRWRLSWALLGYTFPRSTAEEDSGARGNKFEVVVRFTVLAPDVEEAESAVNDIIMEGKLHLLDTDNRDQIYEYDVEEVEPAPI